MRVLKSKEDNDELETINVTCIGNSVKRGCGRLLEVTGLDIQSDTEYCYDGSSDKYYYVICPICQARTRIPYSKLTDEMKRMV